jgi:hypothetical protein
VTAAPRAVEGLAHFAMLRFDRTQKNAMIPPAQQRPSKSTTDIMTTSVIDTLVVVVVLDNEALVPVDSLVYASGLVLLPLSISLATSFHPVTVADAGTKGTCAVAVPSNSSATSLLTVIQVEVASVPQP